MIETIEKINRYFDVEFIDYLRPGTGVCLTSGTGIGLATMDLATNLRWFCDVDHYRRREDIDWESLAILLTSSGASPIVLVGWFTIDVPKVFESFKRGAPNAFEYRGGGDISLAQFIHRLNC